MVYWRGGDVANHSSDSNLSFRHAINTTFTIGGQQLSISTSIGIACYPDDSDTLQALLSFADKAMFHAKAQGGTTLRGIVDIARASDMHVVAEGVETAEQLSAAREAGVELVQGYYYARPMPLEALIDFLQAQKTRPEDGSKD
ncbi:EAL domain-containing protein [Sulfurivirga caldicuralii]|uniref:EAL domain-containing protein n=1 Tax=Sulfurivirga caldicuralii TaxID=364032 RepID=UPI000A03E0B7|nr:EAL domain-containing protein [Sulfurivirga caldicuralii]